MKPKSEKRKKKKPRHNSTGAPFFFFPFRQTGQWANGLPCADVTIYSNRKSGKEEGEGEECLGRLVLPVGVLPLRVSALVKYCPSHGTMPPGFLSQSRWDRRREKEEKEEAFCILGGLWWGTFHLDPSGSPSFFFYSTSTPLL